MLVHEGETETEGSAGRNRKTDILPMDCKLRPRLGCMKAGQYPDQRRLARTVLPQQAMHFTRCDVERHIVERGDAPEPLG